MVTRQTNWLVSYVLTAFVLGLSFALEKLHSLTVWRLKVAARLRTKDDLDSKSNFLFLQS